MPVEFGAHRLDVLVLLAELLVHRLDVLHQVDQQLTVGQLSFFRNFIHAENITAGAA